MLFWHVPKPNEAILISGSKHRDPGGPQFRIVTGHGCFVLPVKQRANTLSLALREAEIVEECVSKQGIRLQMRAVAVFKVGDDQQSIANAARRFLSEQNRMEELVGRVFSGHLRSIVGGLTVEEIIRERDRVAQEIKDGSHPEMEKLGLVVDSLQIQEVEDTSGYINNLAAPHSAAVASQARIAQAQSDQAATESEQEAERNKAEYERQTRVAQAGYKAQVDQAQAQAAQAGPLSQAKASQEVIAEQTRLAEREAGLSAQRLVSQIEKPADAEAYRVRKLAEAERDAMRLRAEGLAGGNQQLLAASLLAQQLPELVGRSAEALEGSNLVVLNGTEGVSQVLSGVAGQGMAILDVLRQGLGLPRNHDIGESRVEQDTDAAPTPASLPMSGNGDGQAGS
ncbi:MAG: SPFH domain-containing protein [Actinomycetota bacterium]|nr:SPFH domain-containing protein [Actinomycetota bacterium]